MGCSMDAMSYLDNACSGKSSCEYYVGPDFAASQPCPKGTASYLAVQYECVPGIQLIYFSEFYNVTF